MSIHMNDFVALAGVIPISNFQQKPDSSVYGHSQMFGMGDWFPDKDFANRPDSSIYAHKQMFGMGADIASAQSELNAIKAKRASVASQIAALQQKVSGKPATARPAVGGTDLKTIAILGGIGYVAYRLLG